MSINRYQRGFFQRHIIDKLIIPGEVKSNIYLAIYIFNNLVLIYGFISKAL